MLYRIRRVKDFIRWDIPNGLKNLWKFRKEVWNFRPFDFAYTLRLMQKSSRELSDHLRSHNFVADSKKRAKQALIFSELCKRLAEEDVYYDDSYFNRHKKFKYRNYRYRYNYDVQYLSKMTRYIPYWWD